LLEGAPARCAGATDGVVHIEGDQAELVFNRVSFKRLLLVRD
jgi:hypothetical protein